MPLLSLLAVATVTARAEDFPDGPGKVIIMRACGKCHSTDQIARQQKTEENWQATVVRMAGRGADVSTDDVNVLVKYLSANFLKLADASKVNVNKASAKDLYSTLADAFAGPPPEPLSVPFATATVKCLGGSKTSILKTPHAPA